MRVLFVWGKAITGLAFIVGVVLAPLSYGHLMVAQHGTLNILDKGVYMVLSLPLTAFSGIDDNDDGVISMVEFNLHRSTIVESIRNNITLGDAQVNAPLDGILLSPVVSYESRSASVSQLTVLGRFVMSEVNGALRFHMGLYGEHATERQMEITATRQRDRHSATFALTPAEPASLLFPDEA